MRTEVRLDFGTLFYCCTQNAHTKQLRANSAEPHYLLIIQRQLQELPLREPLLLLLLLLPRQLPLPLRAPQE